MFDEMDEEAFEYWGNYLEEQEDPLYQSSQSNPEDKYTCAVLMIIALSLGAILFAAYLIISLLH